MPELPEIQTIVDDLNGLKLVGSKITFARVFWPRSIARPQAAIFCRKVHGRTIRAIDRRAKFIRFYLDQGLCMAVHLRMTGRFALLMTRAQRDKHEHVVFALGDGRELRFHDTRKFGRFYLIPDNEPFFDRFGPEPLNPSLTSARFGAMLQKRAGRIKPLLLDQTFIAGLGNIYVDEALWAARIHPLARADRLSREQARGLLVAIRKVLRKGLKNAGTTLGKGEGNYFSLRQGRGRNEGHLNVFRRTGKPCPKCGRAIERIVVGQRSTHLCPRCQFKA